MISKQSNLILAAGMQRNFLQIFENEFLEQLTRKVSYWKQWLSQNQSLALQVKEQHIESDFNQLKDDFNQ